MLRNFHFESLRSFLQGQDVQIGFFQEVLGHHRYNDSVPHQIEQIADEKWSEFSFAKNSVVANCDHGNAILSKFPIVNEHVINLTTNPFEKRSAVITQLDLEGSPLICVCTHLNLLKRSRLEQAKKILSYLDHQFDKKIPLILGGDLNDMDGTISAFFQQEGRFDQLKLSTDARTFPSFYPLLKLDRFLFRGISLTNAVVGPKKKFARFSDHLPLFCEVTFEGI